MSDVTLYPIRGQVAQINGKNEYIVYVPRADKYTYGTVKIGGGLNVVDGLISLDETQIPLKIVRLNGVDLTPDADKRVSITINKTTLGLNNVDNTSDMNKPISTATQNALNDITTAVQNTNEQLITLSTTVTQNKTSVDAEILRLSNLLKEKENAIAFTNYAEVVEVFNSSDAAQYKVGQSVYVQTTMVPDLWVYSIEDSQIEFAYVGDDDIVEELMTNGAVQFGYYKLAMMETKTVDVANAVTLDTSQTITGAKTFRVGNSYVAIKENFATMQNSNSDDNNNAMVYVEKNTVLLGSTDSTGNGFVGITHTPRAYDTVATTSVTGKLTYNGYEVATKQDIETNIITALNTEV